MALFPISYRCLDTGEKSICSESTQLRAGCSLLGYADCCAKRPICRSTADSLCDGDIEHALWCHPGREWAEIQRKRKLHQSGMAVVQCFVNSCIIDGRSARSAVSTDQRTAHRHWFGSPCAFGCDCGHVTSDYGNEEYD